MYKWLQGPWVFWFWWHITKLCLVSSVHPLLLHTAWQRSMQLYFVSPGEWPFRQRVLRRKMLLTCPSTCVLSNAFKKEHRDWRICVLQRVSFGALGDITVVLGIRQIKYIPTLLGAGDVCAVMCIHGLQPATKFQVLVDLPQQCEGPLCAKINISCL